MGLRPVLAASAAGATVSGVAAAKCAGDRRQPRRHHHRDAPSHRHAHLPHLFGTTPHGARHDALFSSPWFAAGISVGAATSGGLAVGLVWASTLITNSCTGVKVFPSRSYWSLSCQPCAKTCWSCIAFRWVKTLKRWNRTPTIPTSWIGTVVLATSQTPHVVRQLDLVISVDTGVAHLAGSLGVQTWLMLHFDADFRWMRNCEVSPWYPGMRLSVRQTMAIGRPLFSPCWMNWVGFMAWIYWPCNE